MRPIETGARFKGQVMPAPSDLASAIGNAGVDVVSSPATIGYLEMACHHLIDEHFEGDEATVGVGFSFQHKAAASANGPVDVEAELIEQDGKRFTFKLEARQGDKVIMTGEHVRALVSLSRFMSSNVAPVPDRELTFWYDVHSPWAYLAARRIGDLARRHRAKLVWRPLQLPRLIEAIDGRRPLEENAAFLEWFQRDLNDWAALQGIKIRHHPDYPLRNSRALRVCLFADDKDASEAFVLRLMQSYWQEAGDITDLDLLGDLAAGVGLDRDQAIAVAADAGYKARLEANTSEAIARGIFGVPTVDAGDKLYFGNDRLDLLDRHLMAVERW